MVKHAGLIKEAFSVPGKARVAVMRTENGPVYDYAGSGDREPEIGRGWSRLKNREYLRKILSERK